MTTRESLAFGVRTVLRARNLFMIFCLLLVNLGVAVAAALPFYRRMDDLLSRQPESDALFAAPSMSFLVDFRALNAEFLSDLTYTVGGAAFLMFLLHVFFAGGLLAVFHSEDRSFSFPKFFAGSGTYFLRFLRLAAFSLAILFGISEAKSRFLDPIALRARAAQTSEWGGIFWEWWPALAILVLVTFVVIVSDYAKARTVVEGRKSMLVALLRSLAMVLAHPRRTLGLFFFIALLEGVALLVFTALQRFAEDVEPTVALVSALVLSQALVFTRIGFRALHFAAATATAKDLLGIPLDRAGAAASDITVVPARPGALPVPQPPTFRYSEPEITELPPIDVPAPAPAPALAPVPVPPPISAPAPASTPNGGRAE